MGRDWEVNETQMHDVKDTFNKQKKRKKNDNPKGPKSKQEVGEGS